MTAKERAHLEAENGRLREQQAGTHPAPCARSCEANAYRIEDEQEGASGEIWARTIRTEIERMLD